MATDAVTVNGRYLSFASAEAKCDGQVYSGIKGLNFKQSLKSKKVKGRGPYPKGRTRGDYEAEGSIEFLKEYAKAFRDALAAKNKSYGLVEFDVLLYFSESKLDPTHEVKLVSCRVEDEDEGHAQGSDELSEKWSLSVMWIEKDGKRMLSPEDAGL